MFSPYNPAVSSFNLYSLPFLAGLQTTSASVSESDAKYMDNSTYVDNNPNLQENVDMSKAQPKESENTAKQSADPLDFDPYKNLPDRKVIVNNLAYKICHEISANTVCMSTGIVATLVLTQRNGIHMDDLIDKFGWLKELITEKGGWNDPILHPNNYIVSRAIKLLNPLIVERNRRLEPNYVTMDDQKNWVHLGYYRNQLVHLFKAECILACALACFGNKKSMADEGDPNIGINVGVRQEDLLKNAWFLNDMFKFEFIPKQEVRVCFFISLRIYYLCCTSP